MGKSLSNRALIMACCVFVALLAVLAVVQYQWSARVTAADAQREREHLNSSAQLFANEFNGIAAKAVQFLQNEANAAIRSGEPVTGVPRLIGSLYYLDLRGKEQVVRVLKSDGHWEDTSMPSWIPQPRCGGSHIAHPVSMVVPIYDVVSIERRENGATSVARTFKWGRDRCFVARVDERYLLTGLLPGLIQTSFGETAANDYHFAVINQDRPDQPIYGRVDRADLSTPFFALDAMLPILPRHLSGSPSIPPGRTAVFIQRQDSFVRTSIGDLPGHHMWTLQVAHRNMPLAEAFERRRWRDLAFSGAVELLLLAAIAFLLFSARRMQQLADQKMRFVAGVSHELRTPVSAISMLSRNQADGLVAGAEKVKQYGELMHQQCRRLNEMVEQTLQLAGIHSGLRRPAKDEIDLPALIQDSIDARRQELDRNGFELDTDVAAPLPPLIGDPKLLRTAFDNLLDNALKHAGGGRWIRVRAVHDAAAREVLLSVEDRGAGIDPTDQAEIFEPFCRGKAAVEAQTPGSGLGLSLVRSAAEAHHGRVTLISEPGHGSTFTLHLPV